MTIQTTKRGYLVLPLLALFGCSLDVSDSDPGTLDDNIAETEDALTVNPTTYTWNQGQATRYMTTIDTSICFLNRVGGNFAGWGEKVFISTAAGSPKGPGVWTLGGTSGQTGVHAQARCIGGLVPLNIMYEEKLWRQGSPPTVLAPVADRACFLTRVEGRFRSWGEEIFVVKSGANWVLDGRSNQADVVAGARCVAISSVENEVNWQAGFAPYPMGNVNNFRRSCHLTRIGGRLSHGGAFVWALPQSDAWNDNWYIGGAGDPMKASGRCVM